MNRWSFVVCTATLLLMGAEPATHPSTVPAERIGDSVVILGDLGLPVGQETTIRGYKKSAGPLQDLFVVETIDDKAAPADLRIQVDGIQNWPQGTKATLCGNEVGVLQFIHLGETNYGGPEDKRWKGPPQELFLSFHVSEIVAPEGLKLEQK